MVSCYDCCYAAHGGGGGGGGGNGAICYYKPHVMASDSVITLK